MKYLFYLVLFSCFVSCHSDDVKIPGALEALENWSQQRSYPSESFPSQGFITAHEYVQKEWGNAASREPTDPWEAIGPWNIGGRTLCLAFNPQDHNTIYAGSASGGLWRSRQLGFGKSWERVPIGFPVLGVSTIAFAPQDSMVMYIGTGEVYNYDQAGTGAAYRNTRGTYGMGILKSEDGGVTWTKSLDWSYNQERGIWAVRVSPLNSDLVYAATTDGIYKSINAGATWSKVFDIKMAMDLEIDPLDDQIVLASFGNFGTNGKGVYKTTNGGGDWELTSTNFPSDFEGKILIDISASDPNVVYASVGNGFSQSDGATWLYRSDDGGASWKLKNEFDYSKWQGWFAHDVAIHPEDPNRIALVGIDILSSNDGGTTITQKSIGGVQMGTLPIEEPDGPPDFSHSDHHFIAYHPSNPDSIFYANDGGIYMSANGGNSFRSVKGGYQTTQFYNGFSVSAAESKFAMGGLQDNSTIIFTDSPAWRRIIGGDGSWTAMSSTNPQVNYGSYQYGNIYRTTDGSDYNYIQLPSGSGDALFIAPFVIAHSDPEIMYLGRTKVMKSQNGGESVYATNANNEIDGQGVFSMEVSPQNPDILYIATAPLSQQAGVFVTSNGGETYEDITAGLPNRYYNDITVAPNNEACVYIAVGGFGTGHVFRSCDYGFAWEDITSNLPDVPTSALIVDPKYPEHIYVGNDLGVFYSTNNGVSWDPYMDGIQDAVLVMDLKIDDSARELYVATHGNGAYTRDLAEPVSATEELADLLINVYPNPVSDWLNIDWVDIKPSKIEIWSQDGKLLDSKAVNQSDQQLKFKVNDLPAGSYAIKVVLADGAQMARLWQKM